jgi:hypothetical protein
VNKHRLLRSLLALALFLGAGIGHARDIELSFKRLPLNYEEPAQQNVGMLKYRGGLSITSTDERFGGLSSLLVSAGGAKLLAATDKGMWFSAELLYSDDGNLSGVAAGYLAPISGPDGKPLTGRYRDAEALARGADGTVLLAFEQHHRILSFAAPARFDAHGLAAEIPRLVTAPAELGEFNSNAAMEALVSLSDGGGLLILTEGLDNERASKPGWLLRDGIAPAAGRLGYLRAPRFRPTGAARLPDGDIVVLERRYTLIGGVAALLRRIASETIRPGARLDGPEIARLAPPITVDNMEGIAARRDSAGGTLIYLVSDDNFSILQRSLLLMFELRQEAD